MVQDAEENAAADAERKKLAEAKNGPTLWSIRPKNL